MNPATRYLVFAAFAATSLAACSTSEEFESDATDAADAGVDGGELIFCSATQATCPEGWNCIRVVFGPVYGDYSGYCEPAPASCPPDDSPWEACAVSYEEESLCALRVVGNQNGRRAHPCTDAEGTPCDVFDPESCGDDVCLPRTCAASGGYLECGGICLTLAVACDEAPGDAVCADETPESGYHGSLDLENGCWANACEAWTSGYRGLLSFRH